MAVGLLLGRFLATFIFYVLFRSVGSSREELQASLDSLEGEEDSDNEYNNDMDTSQAKRIRVADINITR